MGYEGQGVQILTDIAIDPAGTMRKSPTTGTSRIRVSEDPGSVDPLRRQGFVLFFGLAKPVRTPSVGPPSAPQSRSTEGIALPAVQMVRQTAVFATVGA